MRSLLKLTVPPLVVVSAVLVGGAARSATLTVNCHDINQFSPSEVNFFYYKAAEVDGEAEAGRLWGAYHRLRGRCAGNPRAKSTVSVSQELADIAHRYR